VVERTFELVSRRQPGKAIVFIIDEVGQHVARSSDKIEDLRATVEEFGKVGRSLCKARKIPFVIQSYPEPAIQLEAFAGEIGALYVDNDSVFGALMKRGEKKEKYFVPDGHCNARGYGVVARNIYKAMVKAKLFGLK